MKIHIIGYFHIAHLKFVGVVDEDKFYKSLQKMSPIVLQYSHLINCVDYLKVLQYLQTFSLFVNFTKVGELCENIPLYNK